MLSSNSKALERSGYRSQKNKGLKYNSRAIKFVKIIKFTVIKHNIEETKLLSYVVILYEKMNNAKQ